MLAVSDIMTPAPQTVTSDTVLLEVLATMNTNDCRHVPVVDNGLLVGIVSDRDIRLALNSTLIEGDLSAHFGWLERFVARQCMTENPITVSAHAPLYEAAELLNEYKFSALPVVDQRRLVGIVTVTDLLTYLANQREPVTAVA